MELEVKGDEYIFHGRAFQIVKAKNELLAPYGKCIYECGCVLALVPTDEQRQQLLQQIGNARFVKNRYLEDRIKYYNDTKKTLTPAMYKKDYLPKLKQEFDFLNLSDKFALENAIADVDDAYRRFFSKQNKFPQFAKKHKPRGNKYGTCSTNNNIRIFMRDGKSYVRLPKVGEIEFVLPYGKSVETICPAGTSILGAHIAFNRVDKFTVSLQLESVINIPQQQTEFKMSDVCACDVGLKSFCDFGTVDKQEKVDNPRWIKVHEKRLRKLQKSLSRKQYDKKTHTGSKNYEKARIKVAKEQNKIASQRKDFQHKLSRRIANSCKVFICEDLNIKGMMKNRHLSKAIASVGWGQFLNFVKYKVERAGGIFQKVDRWFPSSRLCDCGYINKDLTLKDRMWVCPNCGIVHDRDDHAVQNLCIEGARLLREQGFQFA